MSDLSPTPPPPNSARSQSPSRRRGSFPSAIPPHVFAQLPLEQQYEIIRHQHINDVTMFPGMESGEALRGLSKSLSSVHGPPPTPPTASTQPQGMSSHGAPPRSFPALSSSGSAPDIHSFARMAAKGDGTRAKIEDKKTGSELEQRKRERESEKPAYEGPPKRPKLSIVEKTVPPIVESIIPSMKLYRQMVMCERKLEDAVQRRYFSLRSVYRPTRRRKVTARLYLFNTTDKGTTMQEVEAARRETGSCLWNFRMHADIIPEDGDSDTTDLPRFTQMVSKVSLSVDRRSCVGHNHWEWTNDGDDKEGKKGFVVRRFFSPSRCMSLENEDSGTEDGVRQLPELKIPQTSLFDEKVPIEFPVKIVLFLVERPPRYVPSRGLQELLGLEAEAMTVRDIVTAFWAYVKSNRLLDTEDSRFIIFDQPMQALFGMEKCLIHNVMEVLEGFVVPMKQITLEHKLRLRVPVDETAAQFDIQLEVEDPLTGLDFQEFHQQTLQNFGDQCESLEGEIDTALEAIQTHAKKIEFLNEFSKDPVGFMQRLIVSQTRDLKELGKTWSLYEERSAKFYEEDWVPEAVLRYVHKNRT